MNINSIKQRFGIIGNADALNYAISVANRVSATNLSVLITGESGVGKEIFSRMIHDLSQRKHEKFIAVNCGAIPEGTIDSELFGHEKGAFTGANSDRKGYFETVNGGTIFLDEIGEMPVATQARLLRVLESGEYIRVGSSKSQKTDVRVIAATNVNLLEKVKQGKFREDLYYRLNTVPIVVPSLRERADDIHLLYRKFAADFAEKYGSETVRLNDEAQQVLKSYRWPGNVRELKNIAEKTSVLASDKLVSAQELIQFLPKYSPTNNLPVLASNIEGERADNAGMSDREILYKLLFEMQKDVNDLKRFILQMATQNKVNVNEMDLSVLDKAVEEKVENREFSNPQENYQPVILHNNDQESTMEIAQSLSLADNEKELIIKALEKHRGKRKKAALDLGISERTLYRKIKEYNIPA